MKNKKILKQCCCYEVQGDNFLCPVHYPKYGQVKLILFMFVLAIFFIGGIILAVAGCR